MSDFAVVVGAVQQASNVSSSARVELAESLATLRREADAVLAGPWQGRAAATFDRAWLAWDAGAREVVAALERLSDLLAVAGREYLVRDEISAAGLSGAAR